MPLTPEEIAAEIAAKGAAGDEVLVVMAKGLADATASISSFAKMLLNMNKGKPADSDDDDEPAEPAAGGKGKDDDDDKGDDAPGYQDMQLAEGGGVVGADGQPRSLLDVSKFVFETGAQIASLAKAVQGLAKENTELKGMIARTIEGQNTLGKMVADSAAAQLGTIAPLVKAVGDAREALLNLPAPGITPTRFSQRRTTPDVVLLGGTKRAEVQTLAKALRTSVIDPSMKAMFEQTRRFAADETKHLQVRAKVEAIAAEFTPAS